jgi:hypothetical protein
LYLVTKFRIRASLSVCAFMACRVGTGATSPLSVRCIVRMIINQAASEVRTCYRHW